MPAIANVVFLHYLCELMNLCVDVTLLHCIGNIKEYLNVTCRVLEVRVFEMVKWRY